MNKISSKSHEFFPTSTGCELGKSFNLSVTPFTTATVDINFGLVSPRGYKRFIFSLLFIEQSETSIRQFRLSVCGQGADWDVKISRQELLPGLKVE